MEPPNKALTWLILALNENGLLYYCFQLIFTNGSFLADGNNKDELAMDAFLE